MGTQLAKIERLPAPSAKNPTPALPAWVTKLNEMTEVDPSYLDPNGKYHEAIVLPKEQMPTVEQRAALEEHGTQLAAFLEQTPDKSDECEQRTNALVTRMMQAFSTARDPGAETAEAKLESYALGLGNVPTWAVKLAIVKWYAGQCGSEHNYQWPPAPGVLARIAIVETRPVHRHVNMIKRILSAVPSQEKSEEEREKNKARCRAIGLAVDPE